MQRHHLFELLVGFSGHDWDAFYDEYRPRILSSEYDLAFYQALEEMSSASAACCTRRPGSWPWVPERDHVNGWWRAVPAGGSPAERVNWSRSDGIILLPPGAYDLYWVQDYATRNHPLLLAARVEVASGAPTTVGVVWGSGSRRPPTHSPSTPMKAGGA